MNYYVGTKIVKAKKCTYKNYVLEKYGKYDNDIDDKDGYMVEYSDGYKSFSPVIPFEQAYKKLNLNENSLSDLFKLENRFYNDYYSEILKDDQENNASNNYMLFRKDEFKLIDSIHFQNGVIEDDNPVNGFYIEDLIRICIDRIESFQKTKLGCSFNERAKYYLISALNELQKRRLDRIDRGVLNSYEE